MTVLLLIRGDFYVAQRRRKRGRNNKNLTMEKMVKKEQGEIFEDSSIWYIYLNMHLGVVTLQYQQDIYFFISSSKNYIFYKEIMR